MILRREMRKIVWLVCVVWFSEAGAAGAKVVSLEELRNVNAANRTAVMTGRFIYEQTEWNSWPVESRPGSTEMEIRQDKAARNRHRKMDMLLDHKKGRIKTIQTDMRDLDEVIRKYGLDPNARKYISDSLLSIVDGHYEMQLLGTAWPDEQPELALVELPPMPIGNFDMLYLGAVEDRLLSDEKNPVLTEIDRDGRRLLRVTLSGTVNGLKWSRTIDCDPELNYRFRKIQAYSGGVLRGQTIADKYADVNGIPFPFVYARRGFYSDGTVSREFIQTFEKVQLNLDVSNKGFEIFVPPNTTVNDSAVAKCIYELKKSGNMGIDDIVAEGASWTIDRLGK